MTRPIFILSLPRAGSTLLQRMLSASPDIATTPEPWLALPWLSPLTDLPQHACYRFDLARNAIADFNSRLPGGERTYCQAVRDALMALYQAAGDGKPFFLDKTPRYCLVARRLINLFPEAKFVILWRNPLAVLGSMLSTWAGSRWQPFRYETDLYRVTSKLVAAAVECDDRVYQIHYESLTSDPEVTLTELCRYLQVPYLPEMTRGLSDKKIQGVMGDPTGQDQYAEVSTASHSKWKSLLSGMVRKRYAENYLNWLGEDRLDVMGYPRNDLLSELKQLPTCTSRWPSDIYWTLYGRRYRRIGVGARQEEMDRRLRRSAKAASA